MYNICVEMPSGARSRGYDREKEEDALKFLDSVIRQLREWKGFVADVLLREDAKEISREHIQNAER